ncbi:hypothetical protein DRE_04417 [Drechslerella stenobrocha 248]|uniref:Uncharacterized protein n=1 Tax=Drechslerella stenobrocha 248 TaxID=1043628 RepID=W7HQ11_9PEZI|nr:hypothetical protein DRE_04417 [Drechslerella stenobrocha 248]
MNADTAKHKENLKLQKFLTTAARIYTADGAHCQTCACEFCRYFEEARASGGLDTISTALWSTEPYATCRQFLKRTTIPTCTCEFCSTVMAKTASDKAQKKENAAAKAGMEVGLPSATATNSSQQLPAYPNYYTTPTTPTSKTFDPANSPGYAHAVINYSNALAHQNHRHNISTEQAIANWYAEMQLAAADTSSSAPSTSSSEYALPPPPPPPPPMDYYPYPHPPPSFGNIHSTSQDTSTIVRAPSAPPTEAYKSAYASIYNTGSTSSGYPSSIGRGSTPGVASNTHSNAKYPRGHGSGTGTTSTTTSSDGRNSGFRPGTYGGPPGIAPSAGYQTNRTRSAFAPPAPNSLPPPPPPPPPPAPRRSTRGPPPGLGHPPPGLTYPPGLGYPQGPAAPYTPGASSHRYLF